MATPLSSAPRIVRFGVFELDLRSGELTAHGRRQTLPEQPLALLKALLERPGELVTRDELRHQLWPGDTFVDFEHGLNAAVKRLRDALGDSAESPRFIETVPRRGYRFVAPVEGNERPPVSVGVPDPVPTPLPGARRDRRWWWVVAAGLVFLAALAAWRLRPAPAAAARRESPMHVVPLTSLDGSEQWADFSPDGTQVAFVWDDRHDGQTQVYITIVGRSGVRQITNDRRYVYIAPSWSPDGRQLAVTRCLVAFYPCEIRLVSPLGGQETRVSEFPVVEKVAWSPDGRFLAASRDLTSVKDQSGGIYLLPVAGGSPRRLTATVFPAHDSGPAFSSDGRSLAFVSCRSGYDCAVVVQDLTATLEASAPPRRVTPQQTRMNGSVAWTHDGRGLVFGTMLGAGDQYLWRANADGAGKPERLEMAGPGAGEPNVSPATGSLAFTRGPANLDIYRVTSGSSPVPVVNSSFSDLQPAVSPDGHRIVFCTSRSGDSVDVWMSSVDGSNPQPLTHGPGTFQCSPSWSPDGRTVAFDSQAADGHRHLWTIDAEGGAPSQVTTGAGDQMIPTWSRDGRWIYFIGDLTGGGIVWRVRVADRHVERVTDPGAGIYATESADGREVLYRDTVRRVIGMPLGGGPTHQIFACVHGNAAFADTIHGFYYVPCDDSGSPEVHVLDRRTGRDTVLLRLEGLSNWEPFFGLAVSPDGKTVFYGRFADRLDADIMQIENFK